MSKKSSAALRCLLHGSGAWEYFGVQYNLDSGLLNLRALYRKLKTVNTMQRWWLPVLGGALLGGALLAGMACSSASSGSTGLGANGTSSSVGGSGSNPAFNVCPNGDCSNVSVTDNCDGGAEVVVGTGDVTTASGCRKTVNWGAQDAAVAETKPPPPSTESYACPTGTTRVHVRDVWSKTANPTLGTLDARPSAVVITDTTNAWLTYSAREDSTGCDWYSTCIKLDTTGTLVMSAQAAACQNPSSNSGTFSLAQYASSSDVYIDYTGTSSTIAADYGNYPIRP